jgi:hypothetical protein
MTTHTVAKMMTAVVTASIHHHCRGSGGQLRSQKPGGDRS